VKSAMCAVAAVLLTAGAVDAKITAEFVLVEASAQTVDANADPFPVDKYELQVTSDNSNPITVIGQDATNGLKLVANAVPFVNNPNGNETWKSTTDFAVQFNFLLPGTWFVTPQAPPDIKVDAVDDANELSVTSFGVTSGAIIPADASDHPIAVISVPVGTPLNISNWGNDVAAISGSLGQVDTITYIPEPASVALLGLGGLTLLRRRRA